MYLNALESLSIPDTKTLSMIYTLNARADWLLKLRISFVWYILKQWIALNAGADWLVKLRISCAIYLRATREKMASRFASMTSEENIQINFLCCILSHCYSMY